MPTGALIGIQDMGAAGLTSSSFEMAGRAGSGVIMHLDRVPLREDGMTPYEIMLSESQERMLLVAKKGREQEIIDIVQKWDLDAATIGEVTGDGYVRLFWDNTAVAAVEAAPLSDKAPVYDRPYARPDWLDELEKFDEAEITIPRDFDTVLTKLAGDVSIASKRWIWEQYDHMVQIGTVVLPGSDAAVIRLPESKKGVAMSSDCNSRFCYLNPREGAMHAVAESARNVAASGAKPVALTNCLNYGNPEKPEVMYQMVEGIEGLAEAAEKADGLVVGSPVYYAAPSGALCAVLERAFYSRSGAFAHKPAAAVVSCRRGGASAALDRLHNIFTTNQLPVVSFQYSNAVPGSTPAEGRPAKEGLQNSVTLGRNMAWLL